MGGAVRGHLHPALWRQPPWLLYHFQPYRPALGERPVPCALPRSAIADGPGAVDDFLCRAGDSGHHLCWDRAASDPKIYGISADARQRFHPYCARADAGLVRADRLDSRSEEHEDRKSTRLNSVTNAHLVCRLLLEKNKQD